MSNNKQQPKEVKVELLVTIKQKDADNGWAIYDEKGEKEIAVGFASYRDAVNHANEQGWLNAEYPPNRKQPKEVLHTQPISPEKFIKEFHSEVAHNWDKLAQIVSSQTLFELETLAEQLEKPSLHTQGEWEVRYTSNDEHKLFSIGAKGDDRAWIAELHCDPDFIGIEEQKANAELIVKAVNEYEHLKSENNRLYHLASKEMRDADQLRQSNKELLDAVYEAEKLLVKYAPEDAKMLDALKRFEAIKNNNTK